MRIKAAIIGAGLMGRWHAYAARQSGAEIAVVIDSDMAVAKSLAERYRSQVFNTLDEALEKSNFDIAHICTPVKTHFKLAGQLLAANKHVIVEKPITETLRQARELADLARVNNLLLCPVHQFAFQNGVMKAKKELERRKVAALSVSFNVASAGGAGLRGADLNKMLVEILPHPFSLLTQLWPDENLATEGWLVDNPRDGEFFARGLHQDIPITIQLSLNARPTQCAMVIYHEQGTVHLNLFHGYAVFEPATVSRLYKIISPFVLSAKTFYSAAANLITRQLKRELAYPGLRLLIEQCYSAIERDVPGPISSENYIAVADLCERFSGRLAE